jgi:meso-butanediol dehydrogenase / (S,S)-butanediol dehydrogenase / diacetyl reductase
MMAANLYALGGKTVIVTGGGTGIGLAIARGFLDNGARVAIAGRRKDVVTSALGDYPEQDVLAAAVDIADRAATRQFVRDVIERFGSLDVVVSNAGGFEGGDITELGWDAWTALRATNIDAFVNLAQLTLPELVRSRGSLIAISSVAGQRGDWGQPAYNATKHAVNGFIRSLALDYGSRGVRINAVAPAFTLTDANLGVGRDEASLEPFVSRISLGRPGLPADIAPAVLFLASADAGFITGTILPVDGGLLASSGHPRIT